MAGGSSGESVLTRAVRIPTRRHQHNTLRAWDSIPVRVRPA
ncbi:hypothetical protein ACI797_04800 [Geodermatophilus sp. SYSU D00691]